MLEYLSQSGELEPIQTNAQLDKDASTVIFGVADTIKDIELTDKNSLHKLTN